MGTPAAVRCGTAPASQAPALFAPSLSDPQRLWLNCAIHCVRARIVAASGCCVAKAPKITAEKDWWCNFSAILCSVSLGSIWDNAADATAGIGTPVTTKSALRTLANVVTKRDESMMIFSAKS